MQSSFTLLVGRRLLLPPLELSIDDRTNISKANNCCDNGVCDLWAHSYIACKSNAKATIDHSEQNGSAAVPHMEI